MKVRCAWCQRDMGEKMGPDNLTTHGICNACAEQISKHTEVCPVHGRYFPEPSWFDGKPTCPKCDDEWKDSFADDGDEPEYLERKIEAAEVYYGETLAEVNRRRGY